MNKYKHLNPQIIDIAATIDLGVNANHIWHKYGTEEYWKALKREYKDAEREFYEFIRDHRSRDQYSISFDERYNYVCEFCGHDWGEDPQGILDCCDEMMDAQNIQEIVTYPPDKMNIPKEN